MRAAPALAVLVIVPLLAGCTEGIDDPLPTAEGLAPGELQAGGYYTFAHGGGPLVFTLADEGDASFDLFDGADQRLGSVGFSSGRSGSSVHTIQGVDPGDLVLRVTTINGTLRVESGGRPVTAFRPLGTHVERHILADAEPRANPLPGISFPIPFMTGTYDETVNVTLVRAPTDLRILATGPAAGLVVDVSSSKGIVLTADGDSAPASGAIGEPVFLFALPGILTPQNIRDGALVAHVRADDLAGAVVLEAISYSRARLPAPLGAGPAPADVTFTYGALPDTPVRFTVHPDATTLLLWQEGAGGANATVALFDGRDERLATVVVLQRGSIAVPVVGGGEYVAVLLEGSATLGADLAPSDFDLHPLDHVVTVVPEGTAGSHTTTAGGRYGQAIEDASFPTAFALRASRTEATGTGELETSAPHPFCGLGNRERYLRVDQGGETVLAFREGSGDGIDPAPAFLAATRALGPGSLQVHYDGFGADGCDRPAIDVLSYVRA